VTNSVNIDGLKDTFNSWSNALNQGDLDKFFGYFDDESETLDEDYPWRMNKADFVDHINFHAMGGGIGMWEFFEWIPREVNYKVWGSTGHISGFSTFRGKPKDSGFRQRFMGFTITFHHDGERWKLVSWHQSVLAGRINGASPG
jgi:ketosteroid isomerase-like protein|tara:strand:+ start:1653 stop:2084 length:432 start_codon:yes stop_codon:yes gene_type:complete